MGIRVPEVAKVTKWNPPSDIPDLHNFIISFSAFQTEVDEWHLQKIIFLLGCNKSYVKCSAFHTPARSGDVDRGVGGLDEVMTTGRFSLSLFLSLTLFCCTPPIMHIKVISCLPLLG